MPERPGYAGIYRGSSCKYPRSIPEVSTKYPPRRCEGAPQHITGRPCGRAMRERWRIGVLCRVTGGVKISDLEKFVSFADFWKKGLFFEVDSIVTFCLSYYFIFNGIGDPPAADCLDKKSNQSAAADKTWIFLLKRQKFLQRKHPKLPLKNFYL